MARRGSAFPAHSHKQKTPVRLQRARPGLKFTAARSTPPAPHELSCSRSTCHARKRDFHTIWQGGDRYTRRFAQREKARVLAGPELIERVSHPHSPTKQRGNRSKVWYRLLRSIERNGEDHRARVRLHDQHKPHLAVTATVPECMDNPPSVVLS